MRFGPEDGNSWFRRNSHKLGAGPDRVVDTIKEAGLFPECALEIGCANGWRLNLLRETLGCKECWGCDVSHEAINANVDKNNRLYWREMHNLDKIPTAGFDLVIYGFCLYVATPQDLFKIAKEGDRVLKDGGSLVIYDFAPERPYSREYVHNSNLRSSKMQHERLWLASPVYSLVEQRFFAHEDGEEITEDTRVAVSILRKNINAAFPLKS